MKEIFTGATTYLCRVDFDKFTRYDAIWRHISYSTIILYKVIEITHFYIRRYEITISTRSWQYALYVHHKIISENIIIMPRWFRFHLPTLKTRPVLPLEYGAVRWILDFYKSGLLLKCCMDIWKIIYTNYIEFHFLSYCTAFYCLSYLNLVINVVTDGSALNGGEASVVTYLIFYTKNFWDRQYKRSVAPAGRFCHETPGWTSQYS